LHEALKAIINDRAAIKNTLKEVFSSEVEHIASTIRDGDSISLQLETVHLMAFV
jgi:hypothetical protein